MVEGIFSGGGNAEEVATARRFDNALVEEVVERDIVGEAEVEVDIQVIALCCWPGGTCGARFGPTNTFDPLATFHFVALFTGEEGDIEVAQQIAKADDDFLISGFSELVADHAELQVAGAFVVHIERHAIFQRGIYRYERAEPFLDNDFGYFEPGVEVAVQFVYAALVFGAQVVQTSIKAIDRQGRTVGVGQAEILEQFAEQLDFGEAVIGERPVDFWENIEHIQAGSIGVLAGIGSDKCR